VRLCVPSWLRPGTWLENVRDMEGEAWIEGVELLFFSWDEESRACLARERDALADLAGRFEFSVHLPDPLAEDAAGLVESTRAFVSSYLLHPPHLAAETSAWAALVSSWRARWGDLFLLEYTGAAPFASAEAALPGLPLCADTGRLLLDGLDPETWIAAREGRVRAVHLHGTGGGKDHLPLAGDEPWLLSLAPRLAAFPGRVELELFTRAGAEASRAALAAAIVSAAAGRAAGAPREAAP